jgi:hypothetical protein
MCRVFAFAASILSGRPSLPISEDSVAVLVNGKGGKTCAAAAAIGLQGTPPATTTFVPLIPTIVYNPLYAFAGMALP